MAAGLELARALLLAKGRQILGARTGRLVLGAFLKVGKFRGFGGLCRGSRFRGRRRARQTPGAMPSGA